MSWSAFGAAFGWIAFVTEPTLDPETVAVPVQAVTARAVAIRRTGRYFMTPL